MATNTFFRNYNEYGNEANLIEDLTIESIHIHGVDTIYLSRSLQAVDDILNEDDLSIFDQAYEMEMYIKSVDGLGGEGDFLSKFGLTIRDQITFTVANRTFDRYATSLDSTKSRPLEGDLIYFPMNMKFFKIMHVEHESVFYQLGKLNVFDLKCELFEYSNERFQTGRPGIDEYWVEYNAEGANTSLTELNIIDPISKNIFFETEANDILDFSEDDPFQEEISSPTDV
jgi:hypothetical protein